MSFEVIIEMSEYESKNSLSQAITEILSSPVFRELRNPNRVLFYEEQSVSMRNMLEKYKRVKPKTKKRHKKRKKKGR